MTDSAAKVTAEFLQSGYLDEFRSQVCNGQPLAQPFYVFLVLCVQRQFGIAKQFISMTLKSHWGSTRDISTTSLEKFA